MHGRNLQPFDATPSRRSAVPMSVQSDLNMVNTTSPDSIELPLADMLGSMLSLDRQRSHIRGNEDDESALVETCEDSAEEPGQPPPLPYYDRPPSAPTSFLNIKGVMPRGRSHSPERTEGQYGRELLRAGIMTKSMPNLHSSRSLHNRSVGISLSKSSESRSGKRNFLHVQEFEQLLDAI